MTRITLTAVNAALEAAGIKAELMRSTIGGGYHYFIGEDVERVMTATVYVAHTTTYTIPQWVELAHQLKRESNGRSLQ